MWQTLILFSILMSPVSAVLQSQELQPVILKEYQLSTVTAGRTYNNYRGSRVLASKKRTYPFLDQMEELLYPGKDFEKENPGKRLERLEIATFGSKQAGSIPDRITKLESEVESWQIANAQALTIINSRTQPNNKEQAFSVEKQARVNQRNIQQAPQIQPYTSYNSPNQYQQMNPRKREIDYDYENYRMANPLIRSIGRKAINALFSF